MFQELYRGTSKHGLVELYRSGSRYEIVLAGGGRVERHTYDVEGMRKQLQRFEIPETVLRSGQ